MPARVRSGTSKSTPAAGPRAAALAIVVSRYNASITDRLLAGAKQTYTEEGGDAATLRIIPAPGSYELPALALAAAQTGRFRGVVALGCLIKGETSHDRYIAEAVAHGLVSVTLATGVPVAFGVLTVDTPEQADDRAGGAHGNKGSEAMAAMIDAVHAIDDLRAGPKSGRSGPSFGKRVRALPDKARTGIRRGGKR